MLYLSRRIPRSSALVNPTQLTRKRWNSSIRKAANLNLKPPLAFAFDIDGVLLHGDEVIPQARTALNMLAGDNKLGMKIPYILVTNGGGTSEKERCRRLTEKLGCKISLPQFMQAHTVLKTIVGQFADKPVLVLGGRPGAVPAVAEEYGFKKVYTTLDILAWNPHAWPFHELDSSERAFVESRPPFDPTTRFAGIFVFHDPRNWALDVQITTDILLNKGYVLPSSMLANENSGSDPKLESETEYVKLVFCNPDLLWRANYPTSRFGQGAFRTALEAVYKARTGRAYPYTQFGKPTKATYEFAERLLREQVHELNRSGDGHREDVGHIPRVYMVGDNPESDIAGANTHGWRSVLVKTGVYDSSHDPLKPELSPNHIAENVEDAVKWAIEQEASKL